MTRVLQDGCYCETICRTMDLAGFRLTETVYRPGTVLGPHSHSTWYLCYIPQGFYHETVEGKTRLCQPSTVAAHPAGETHSERFHHHLTRSFNIQGSGDLIDYRFKHGGLPAHLASRLYSAFLTSDSDRAESLLLELLNVMKSDESDRLQKEPKWLRQARDLLRESIPGSASLSATAAILGVRPTHLATAFRRFHGCTAGDYLRRLRVEHACRIIARGDDLATVALDSGFCDQSHFTRTFRQLMGVTPGEYRAML